MRKIVMLLFSLSILACSSTPVTMGYGDESPRGITAFNVTRKMQSRAYQTAESHCAKYNKVPRVRKKVKQESADENVHLNTFIFECIRPSR